jgi:hypothetical protein
MEGSEIWISFRRILISILPGFDFVPTGFDFVPTDFEFLPRVLEAGKERGVDTLRGCGVAIFRGIGLDFPSRGLEKTSAPI